MNKLDENKRAGVVAALVEGCSILSIVRMTGVSKNTIAKLLIELGAACSEYLDKALVNLPCKRIQCDEIWSFVGAKDKNIPAERKDEIGIGSAWTWVAIDADTKLVCSWLVGKRDPGCATEFIQDMAGRLANRVQLTTDGLKMYLTAVSDGFGSERLITPCWSRFTATIPKARSATAPQFARGARRTIRLAIPIRSTFLPAMWSVKISRCVWGCGGLPG
jgi:hypothetical protein